MEPDQREVIPFAPEPQPERATAIVAFEDLADRAKEYYDQARSANTRRAYESDWRGFSAWCSDRGLEALPAAPQTLALWLAEVADRWKTASIQRRLSAIAQRHRDAGHASPTEDPTVGKIWAGIRRACGTASTGKAAMMLTDLRLVVEAIPEGLLGMRDRALLLTGFLAALRRGELVGLNVKDVVIADEGALIHLRRSKTDQEGKGQAVAVPFASNPALCPIRALRAWLGAAAIVDGPIFRPVNRHGRIASARLSSKAVADVVKRRAAAAGLDPARFAGHSLRSGFATSAAKAGATLAEIMNTTRHKSVNVAMNYIRPARAFDDLAAYKLGV